LISAQGVANPQWKTSQGSKENCLMDMNTKTSGTKTGAPQAFREMTEKGTTQAKETYEKMSVASTEAADLIQNSYLTAVKRVQDYNNKFFEFANENTNAAFDFIQKVSGVRLPSAFIELSAEHARKQLASLTEQAKQLATLAQKASLTTAEPLKTASKPSVR
jgi:phasin